MLQGTFAAGAPVLDATFENEGVIYTGGLDGAVKRWVGKPGPLVGRVPALQGLLLRCCQIQGRARRAIVLLLLLRQRCPLGHRGRL